MSGPYPDRRELLAATAAALGAPALTGQAPPAKRKRYPFKKSINLWAFPYPEKMSLEQCLQAREGRGLRWHRTELRPRKRPVAQEWAEGVRRDSPHRREDRHRDQRHVLVPVLALSTLEQRCREARSRTGTGRQDRRVRRGLRNRERAGRARRGLHPVADRPRTGAERRVRPPREGSRKSLIPAAEKLKVYLNIENIFFNGYLMTPIEMNDFVDSFQHERVRVHFDTGNIMMYQFPEHWIARLGKRIKNVHLKEFTKKGTDVSLETFRPLLDGTTNWPAVLEAFDTDRLQGLSHLRVLPPLPALPRGARSTRPPTRSIACWGSRGR